MSEATTDEPGLKNVLDDITYAMRVAVEFLDAAEDADADSASYEVVVTGIDLLTVRYFYDGGSASVTISLADTLSGEEDIANDVHRACKRAVRCAKDASPW